jgi:Xaa-Pro aminopeptidase
MSSDAATGAGPRVAPPDASRLERRLAAARAALAELGADALLVTDPANVRYLSNFSTPKDARVLVTLEDAWLVTDGRYTVQAQEESWLPFDLEREWLPWVAERVGARALAVEAEHVTLAQFETLQERLGRAPMASRGLLARARLVKDEGEIGRIREAARITDLAYAHVLDGPLRAGARELDVALALEAAMRDAGAEGAGFEIIVASGPRSAMPHGVASSRVLERGDLVTLDFGAKFDGYHADMTRAVAIGGVSARLRELFDAVLSAQEASVAAIRPGLLGAEADAIARRSLARAGLDAYFAHSLGHGVGLDIHEGPRLSARSDDVLAPGMLVTVEPGVYVPGFGGVRIEDLVLVTDDGAEVLSRSPKGYAER